MKIKKKFLFNVFSPISFVLLSIMAFFLYSMKLTKTIEYPEFLTIFYTFSSIFMFLLGSIVAMKLKIVCIHLNNHRLKVIHRKNVILVVWVLYLLSLSLFIYEHLHFYKVYNTIPIFSPMFEILRFEFPINGYIHLIAMMNYIFLYILLVDFYFYRKFYTKMYKYSLVLFLFISILLGILIGSRGIILNFLAIVFVAIKVKRNISIAKIVLIAFIALYLFGLFKLFRDYFFYGENLLTSIKEDWVFSNPFTFPLYFAYLGISMNFEILNEYISNISNYYLGYFSFALPFYSLLPGHQYDFIDLQEDILGIDFHGTLTSTIFSAPYIDFGLLGTLYFFFLGFIISILFKKALLSQYRIRYNLIYGYVFWMLILGIYTNMFNKFYVLLNIITITIIAFQIERVIYER